MTTQTIRNGTSIEVVIPTGQTLKVVAVSGTYNASVVRGTGIGTTLSTLATGASYGPYAYDSVVRLVSSDASEIDFDVAVTPSVATDTVANYAFDSSGNVTGLVGPGGYSVPIFTSGLVKRMAGSIVAEATPNLTLLDTGASAGITNTQIGMLTIPGGVMGPTSRLLIHGIISATGGNGKTISVRAGPASGTYATATGFGGQSGLSNQLTMAQTPMIWNQGTLASQLATPANIVSYSNTGSSGTPVVALSIDTSLDWNIYFGIQMSVLNGGDSMTLRHCYAQILN